MSVNTATSFKDATEARRQIRILTDMAQVSLMNAISCLEIGVNSDRYDYYMDLCSEYERNIMSLLRSSAKIAGLVATAVPESVHAGKHGQDDEGDARKVPSQKLSVVEG